MQNVDNIEIMVASYARKKKIYRLLWRIFLATWPSRNIDDSNKIALSVGLYKHNREMDGAAAIRTNTLNVNVQYNTDSWQPCQMWTSGTKTLTNILN